MITKPVEQAGFIYLYLSNESNTSHDVYFDDLRITHTKSKILQEDHYYSGGATISALSSSAPLSKPNRFKYQGKEEQAEFGLNLLDFEARMYDPWLWRTLTHDPLAELFYEWSPYHWAGNNPVINIDPSGQDWYRFTDENGNQSVLWQEGNAATVDVDGVTCSNIGENYYHVQEGLLTVFNQNEIVRSAYLGEISEERRSELASMDESPVFEHLRQEQYNDLLLGLNGGTLPLQSGALTPVYPVYDVLTMPRKLTLKGGSMVATKILGVKNGGGKNAKHANQQRKLIAKEKYEKAKKELEES